MTRVRELQHAFDRTFAEPPRSDVALQDDFLAMTIGGDPYAMRLSEVAGLYLTRKMTGLPGSVPALLGVVGLRGALVPVYDLGSLLGYSKAAPPRWLAVIVDGQVAVGFEQFDGHLRVARDTIAEAAPGHAASRRPLVRESLATETVVRPIIHLPSVLEAVAVMARHATRPKE
jgi:purine-binding chemotaxis protein CheW